MFDVILLIWFNIKWFVFNWNWKCMIKFRNKIKMLILLLKINDIVWVDDLVKDINYIFWYKIWLLKRI